MGYSWLSIAAIALIVFQSLLVALLLLEQYRRRRASAALDERLSFETLLSDLSADFTKLHSEEVDPKIKKWLSILVEFLGVDRGTLIQLFDGNNAIQRIHSYHTPGIEPAPELITAEQSPWYVDQLRRGVTLSYPRILEELPGEAVVEREYICRTGIKSHLGIPVTVGDSVIFALSFTTIKCYRSWPADLIVRLRTVGEIFAQAMVRKEAEEALRESEERFRQLTENIDAVLFISERLSESGHLRVLYVSPSYEKVWGRPRENLYRVTRSWLEGIHHDDREQVEAALPDVESGKFDQEYRIVRPDGVIRWVHDRVYPIYDDLGQIYRIAGIVEDITERKQVEEILARLKFFSDTTIDCLPGIFYLFDGRGKYLRWNRNFERVTGYSREEILGMDPLRFFDGEDKHLIAAKIGEAFAAGEATVEAELVSKDGRATPYFFTARRIHFDKRSCLIGMGFDITERRRAEEELRRLTARLLQLQDEERHRIASELHDSLGQSLAIIRNRATICLRSLAEQEQVKEQLEEISATAAAAIDDVREITHNLRPYELDRLGLVEAIESMTVKVSNSTAIRLSCELDRIEELFTPEEETWIYRIVQEGLNNVVRHAEATEGRVVIKREGSEVIISVEDNGKGIETRAGEWNGNEGRGLGLAGIAERARMLGGTHEIRSEPGRGTTLTVRLGLRHSRSF